MGRVTRRVPSTRVDLGDPASPRVVRRPDTVAVEEPLEMRVDGVSLSVTMRTPGDDFDLAIGFLLTEGMLHDATDVRQIMHCLDEDESGSPTYNVVDLTLAPGAELHTAHSERRTVVSSACGVCGKATIDAVTTASRYAVAEDLVSLDPAVLQSIPDLLRERQKGFATTGGMHAAGLFTADGEVLVVREDVGRHNAVDKVIGWAAREGRLPLTGHVLGVSARASFELTQKAAMAGIPALVAVSAPTSLAVDVATATGITLVAFTRPPRMSVYAGASRLGLG